MSSSTRGLVFDRATFRIGVFTGVAGGGRVPVVVGVIVCGVPVGGVGGVAVDRVAVCGVVVVDGGVLAVGLLRFLSGSLGSYLAVGTTVPSRWMTPARSVLGSL